MPAVDARTVLRMLTLLCLVSGQLLGRPLLADETPLAIVGAAIVNPLGFPSHEEGTVIVAGDTIVAVGPTAEVAVPADARIVDGRGRWVIPGLMDLHVHFGQGSTLNGAYEGGKPKVLEESESFAPGQGLVVPKLAVEQKFRQLARAGVTSVRSLGEYHWAHSGPHALRPRAESDPLAPRLVLSTPAYRPRSTRPSSQRVTSAKQGTTLFRMFHQRHKPELLKVWWVEGRFTGEVDEVDEWKRHQPIVEALLTEAKQLGIGNGVEAIEAWKAKEVARMGGNLVHGIFFGEVDQECLDLMKANNTQITSTLLASTRYFGAVAGHLQYSTAELLLGDPHAMAQTLDVRGLNTDELVIPRGGSRFDGMTLTEAMRAPPYTEEIVVAVENLRRIHKAGIPVGIGTDAGIPAVLFGASIFPELALHAEAGLTPHEILTSATINNARIAGVEAESGSITAGKKADVVILTADPRLDILHAAKISDVLRDGHHYRADELNADTPWDVVTRLRNAWNCADREAMASLLAADVTLRDVPGNVTRSGTKEVLERIAQGADGKALRAVESSTANGDTVMQKERWPDGSTCVIQYVVANKLISRVEIVSVVDAPK